MRKKEFHWVPLSFKWTIEANDLLIKSDPVTNLPSYQSGLGDINFFRELVQGKTNKETEKLKGWELNFGEILYVYGGSFEEDPERGNRRFSSNGYAVNLAGIMKSIFILNPDLSGDQYMRFIFEHIGCKFSQSSVTTYDITSPLMDTKYYSINFFFKNWL